MLLENILGELIGGGLLLVGVKTYPLIKKAFIETVIAHSDKKTSDADKDID